MGTTLFSCASPAENAAMAGVRAAAPERAGLSPSGAGSGASRANIPAAFLIRLVGKNMDR
jgi:hypothetical protein